MAQAMRAHEILYWRSNGTGSCDYVTGWRAGVSTGEIGGVMDRKLYEAVKILKEHCAGRNTCTGCPFDADPDEDGYIGCFDANPSEWKIEHFEQEVEEDA